MNHTDACRERIMKCVREDNRGRIEEYEARREAHEQREEEKRNQSKKRKGSKKRIQCEEFDEEMVKEFEKYGHQRDGPTDDGELDTKRVEKSETRKASKSRAEKRKSSESESQELAKRMMKDKQVQKWVMKVRRKDPDGKGKQKKQQKS